MEDSEAVESLKTTLTSTMVLVVEVAAMRETTHVVVPSEATEVASVASAEATVVNAVATAVSAVASEAVVAWALALLVPNSRAAVEWECAVDSEVALSEVVLV